MEIIRASLDRFEGDYAVIYSDKDKRKFDIPRGMLIGIRPGTRLFLSLENGAAVKVDVDNAATDEAKDRIRKKNDALRRGSHIRK